MQVNAFGSLGPRSSPVTVRDLQSARRRTRRLRRFFHRILAAAFSPPSQSRPWFLSERIRIAMWRDDQGRAETPGNRVGWKCKIWKSRWERESRFPHPQFHVSKSTIYPNLQRLVELHAHHGPAGNVTSLPSSRRSCRAP